MKWLLVFIVLIMSIPVQADDIMLSVCRLDEQTYQFSYTGAVDGWWFSNTVSSDLNALTAVGAGTEWHVMYAGTTESIFAASDTPFCDQQNIWKPGAPSIPIELTTDCAWVEIRDPFGNWSQVESNAQPVLLHYGEALIGGQDQNIDPADYRAIPTECY